MSSTASKLPPLATLGPFIALILACAFFATQSERFLSAQNFALILQQVMVVAVIAIGQTLVILTAGIDLSCGMGRALGGMAVTMLFGLINGLLVTKIKLPPFIVTLGTLNIAFAATQLYSGAQTITDIPAGMTALGNTSQLGQPAIVGGAVLMRALYLVAWFALREPAPGRHVYAVGNSPEATRLTGIATDKVLLCVYVLAGLFYGIASVLSVGRTGAGDPNAGQTENLDAIHAVGLGGTSLFGGGGLILGTLVGALIVGVFRNGLTLMGVSSVYQILVTGILVILAGATAPDEGEILLDGQRIQFKSPIDARRAGIETVYQDLAVAPAMTIAENLFLGRELRRPGLLGSALRMLDKKKMLEESVARMSELKVGIRSMTQAVETLSGGQRQCVAVARAAAFARHVVIMDEPTAALGVKEGNMVLELIRRVRDKGLPVILISHNMPHVFEIADRIHIARLGKRAAVVNPKKISMSDTVAVMTGAMAATDLPAECLA